MIRLLVALAAASVATAPAAAADPEILVPECTGGQVAQAGECKPEPVEALNQQTVPLLGNFPGSNPNLPPWVTPANFPVVFPLGLTPRNFPSVLPLGLTPQNVPLG